MKLNIDGIKGQRGEFDLGRRALLTGPNGSGKSAVMDALHLALTGKVPSLGLGSDGTQSAGKLLCIAEPDASVRLEYDGGTVARRIEETAKSARVVTKGDTEDDGAVAVVGDGMVWADFTRLTTAAPAERRDVLLSMLPRPDDTEVRRWMTHYATTRAVDVLADQPHRFPDMDDGEYETKKLMDLGGDVAVDAAADGRERANSGQDSSAGLHALHNASKAAASNAREKKAAVNAIKPRDGDAELVASLQALQGEADKASAALSEISQANRSASSDTARRERRDARRSILDREIERLTPQVAALDDLEKALAVAEAKRDEAVVDLQAHKDAARVDPSTAAYEAAMTDCAAADSLIEELTETGRDLRLDRDALTDDCPTCGQAWPDADSREKRRDEFTKQMEKVGDRIHEAETETEKALNAKEKAKAAVHALRAQDEFLQDEANKADTALRLAEDGIEEATRAKASIKSSHAELARLALDDKDAPVKAKGFDAEDEARAKAKAATEAVNTAREAKARIDMTAEAGVEDAVLRARVLRACHQGAIAGDAAYMRHIGQSVIDRLDSMVQAVGLGEATMWDWTGRTFEVGVVRGDRRIPLIAMSKGEQVLYAAALLGCFPPEQEGLKVLTLEVAEVDSKSLTKLMAALTDTEHDLVVLATCHAPRKNTEGWSHIRMGGQ